MPRGSKGKGSGGDGAKADAKSETSDSRADAKAEAKAVETKSEKVSANGGAVGGAALDDAKSSGPSTKELIQEKLLALPNSIRAIQVERDRSEHNLVNIRRTHDKVKEEGKLTPYYRQKLKTLYSAAMTDAEVEAEVIRNTLDKISEIKKLREKTAKESQDSGRPKQIMRRGVLMSQLQQNAATLPLWVSKPGEKPPPLCGAVPAESSYVSQPEDKVAARVKGQDGEENWILAEVVSFNAATGKYEVDDVDAEEGKERHSISRRRVVPLPMWKANPETDPGALFAQKTLILALYPQTTCFYRALVDEPPKNPQDDYSVLFEDTSYATGYSPALMVAQRYVIVCRDEKRK